jgi:ADP-heptose:LPS heptosyltransferase
MIVMLSTCAIAQSKAEKVFEVVPEAERARLLERLHLYVEYQREKDYDKLFDLFSDATKNKYFNGLSKADFVKAYQSGDERGSSSRLIEFTPTDTQKISADGNDYLFIIYGRAKVAEGNKVIEKKHVSIEAQLQNGDWYFSLIADIVIN